MDTRLVLFVNALFAGLIAGHAQITKRRKILWGVLTLMFSPLIIYPIYFLTRKRGLENEPGLVGGTSDEFAQAQPSEKLNPILSFNFKNHVDLSTDELKQYLKELKLELKITKQIYKENSREMTEIRAQSSLTKIKGSRGGVFGAVNTLNSLNRDGKIRPLQSQKEILNEHITKIEREILTIDSLKR